MLIKFHHQSYDEDGIPTECTELLVETNNIQYITPVHVCKSSTTGQFVNDPINKSVIFFNDEDHVKVTETFEQIQQLYIEQFSFVHKR